MKMILRRIGIWTFYGVAFSAMFLIAICAILWAGGSTADFFWAAYR